MMNWAIDIMTLAQNEGDGGYGQYIIFAVVAIMWIVGAIVKKTSEKQVQERAQRRREELDRELAKNRKVREAHGGKQNEKDWEVLAPAESFEPTPPPKRLEPTLVQLQPVEEVLSPLLPSEQERKKSIRGLITKRSRPRGAHRSSLGSDVGTIEPTGISEASPPAEAHGPRLRLVDPETAREAIIFHEIFSSPRALRDEPEMWD